MVLTQQHICFLQTDIYELNALYQCGLLYPLYWPVSVTRPNYQLQGFLKASDPLYDSTAKIKSDLRDVHHKLTEATSNVMAVNYFVNGHLKIELVREKLINFLNSIKEFVVEDAKIRLEKYSFKKQDQYLNLLLQQQVQFSVEEVRIKKETKSSFRSSLGLNKWKISFEMVFFTSG